MPRIHDDVFDPLPRLDQRELRASNEVAAGSEVGRIDGKVPRGVSPIQEPSLGRRPKFSCSWSGTTGSPG